MKIYNIRHCKMCPGLSNYYDINGVDLHCGNANNKVIGNPYKLPAWCPLEDYKEVK